MNVLADDRKAVADIDTLISEQAQEFSAKLQDHHLKLFPPAAEKPLRSFQIGEVAKFLGVKGGYLRISRWKKGPPPRSDHERTASYTAEQIQELRAFLDETGRATRRYLPHRRGNEHLQVLAVVNFKGGSCKTTTAAHLANISPCAGTGC